MTKAAVKAAAEKALHNYRVTLHLTNGEQLLVGHPDQVSYSPDTPEIIVWPKAAGFVVVAMAEIASITAIPTPTGRRQS